MKTRSMSETDWPAVSRIYAEGIRTGIATFEASPPATWAEWMAKRMRETCIVCENQEQIVGWAALSPVSSRCVYRGVAEVSVYVAEVHRRKGVGQVLLTALITLAEQLGVWTLQAQMFPENRASVAFHTRNRFRIVGTRKKIGKMTYGHFQGQWKDNVLMERRSRTTGI